MSSKLLSTTPEELLPRNSLRRSWIVQNEDSAIDCYIKRERSEATTVSSTDHDHRLSAGGLITLNDQTDGPQAVQDRWTIIAASGTPRVSFFETEAVAR